MPDHRNHEEAIRQIDILGKRIGSIEVRWKTHSVKTGIDIIRMHLPEMVIVGLGPTPEPAIESISTMARISRSCISSPSPTGPTPNSSCGPSAPGAHDYLCKPIKEDRPSGRRRRKRPSWKATRKESVGRGGRILSVFSNKGGTGPRRSP